MALLKSIETNKGISAEYWMVSSFEMGVYTSQDGTISRINYTLDGFIDKIKRDDGFKPVDSKNYYMEIENDPYVTGYNLLRVGYTNGETKNMNINMDKNIGEEGYVVDISSTINGILLGIYTNAKSLVDFIDAIDEV